MYRWAHPEFLNGLWVLPLVWVLFVLYRLWQKRAQKNFGENTLFKKMAKGISYRRPVVKLVFWSFGLASLILGLANPQVGTKLETVKREGIDMVFALDVSLSMTAQDVKPSRLENAKLVVSKTLNELGGDRVGMIIYAGAAFPALPITTDYAAARMALNGANPGIVSSQGTDLESALELAVSYFDEHSKASRVLVLLTDGEDHESGWGKLVDQANDLGIKVVTVGFGTNKGGPLPVSKRGNNVAYKRNELGEVVISKRNETDLIDIAKKTDGKYLDGNIPSAAVSGIMNEIQGLETTEFEAKVVTNYEDKFQLFLAIGLGFLLIEILISQKRQFWLERLGIIKSEEE